MRSKFIVYGLVVAALYACTHTDNEPGARIHTRMKASVSAPTDFQEGDEIGVSARAYNVPICSNQAWRYSSGVFTSADSIAVEIGTELRLSAYYPYEAALDNAAPTLSIDTRAADYTDYLWATDTLTMSGSGVQADLQFRHILTRIECVFLPSAEYPQDETFSLSLSGVKTKVEKHIVTGAESLSGEGSIVRNAQPHQPVWIEMPAQSAKPVISFAYAGNSYLVTPATEQHYEAGRSYRYEIAFGSQSDPTISLMQIGQQSTNFQLAPRR